MQSWLGLVCVNYQKLIVVARHYLFCTKWYLVEFNAWTLWWPIHVPWNTPYTLTLLNHLMSDGITLPFIHFYSFSQLSTSFGEPNDGSVIIVILCEFTNQLTKNEATFNPNSFRPTTAFLCDLSYVSFAFKVSIKWTVGSKGKQVFYFLLSGINM